MRQAPQGGDWRGLLWGADDRERAQGAVREAFVGGGHPLPAAQGELLRMGCLRGLWSCTHDSPRMLTLGRRFHCLEVNCLPDRKARELGDSRQDSALE